MTPRTNYGHLLAIIFELFFHTIINALQYVLLFFYRYVVHMEITIVLLGEQGKSHEYGACCVIRDLELPED